MKNRLMMCWLWVCPFKGGLGDKCGCVNQASYLVEQLAYVSIPLNDNLSQNLMLDC